MATRHLINNRTSNLAVKKLDSKPSVGQASTKYEKPSISAHVAPKKKTTRSEAVYLAKMKLDKAISSFDFGVFSNMTESTRREFELFCSFLVFLADKPELNSKELLGSINIVHQVKTMTLRIKETKLDYN